MRLDFSKLTLKQLQQLQADLNEQIATKTSKSATQKSELVKAWHTAIHSKWAGFPPLNILENIKNYSAFERGTKEAESLVPKFFYKNKRIREIERIPVRKILAECLIINLQRQEKCFTNEVLVGLQNIREAVENSFPGYIQGNMLQIILKARNGV